MTLLFILWGTALAVMGLSLGAGFFLLARGELAGKNGSLGDFFREEFRSAFAALRRCTLRFLPHGRRAISEVSTQGVEVRDRFMKWIFGKMERERGKTSSFFLKHLAEHQESLRRGFEGKQGY